MNVREAAEGYLADEAEQWHGIAAAIAAKVAKDVAGRMGAVDNRLDLTALCEGLCVEFKALLLAPQSAVLVARARSDAQAFGEIARCLRSWADDVDAPFSEKWSAEWDEVVTDIVEDGDSTYLRAASWERVDEDTLGSFPLRLPIRPSVQAHLALRRLRTLVATACDGITEGPGPSESLVRLGVVDVALYRALSAHPELLQSLDWRTFERLLADTLATFGYQIDLQRGTKDGGIDIFALRTTHFGAEKYILQAKRWSNRVSVEPVRQLMFLQSHHRATKCCLATTSSFTRGAWELAEQYRWQLELRDWEGLREWIREAHRLKEQGS